MDFPLSRRAWKPNASPQPWRVDRHAHQRGIQENGPPHQLYIISCHETGWHRSTQLDGDHSLPIHSSQEVPRPWIQTIRPRNPTVQESCRDCYPGKIVSTDGFFSIFLRHKRGNTIRSTWPGQMILEFAGCLFIKTLTNRCVNWLKFTKPLWNPSLKFGKSKDFILSGNIILPSGKPTLLLCQFYKTQQ